MRAGTFRLVGGRCVQGDEMLDTNGQGWQSKDVVGEKRVRVVILVVKPTSRMRDSGSRADLEDDCNVIGNANITIRKVEYVRWGSRLTSRCRVVLDPPAYEQPENPVPCRKPGFLGYRKVPADAAVITGKPTPQLRRMEPHRARPFTMQNTAPHLSIRSDLA